MRCKNAMNDVDNPNQLVYMEVVGDFNKKKCIKKSC